MLEQIEIIKPMEIEKKSMEIISQGLGGRTWPEPEFSIVKRCIHTSADFDYADNLRFSKNAGQKAMDALRTGAVIVTDTNMARAGVNKKRVEEYKGEVICFMADEDVAAKAKARGCTRAAVSMEKAAKTIKDRDIIFAIGNAPTALIELYDLIAKGLRPALVIAAAVGFVNVVEAKELIMKTDVPYIVCRGRKGGSNIAAAICNALLYQMGDDSRFCRR